MEANRPRIEIMNSDASRAYEQPEQDYAYEPAVYDPALEQAVDAPLAAPAEVGAAAHRRTRRGTRGKGGSKSGAPTQRVNPLQRLEGLFEGLFEGSFTKLFRSKIQVAELAHKLERVMEDGQQVSVGKILVPNAYELELNPEDYAPFAAYKTSLEHDMAEYIFTVARQHGYKMTTRFPLVRLSANEEVGKRDIRAGGRIVDPRLDPAAASELEGEIERTRAMRIPPQYLANPRPQSLTFIGGKQQGTVYPIQGAMTRIGRGLDNDIVIDDPRVSRHHAEVRWQAGRYSLFDMGSTNGTFLNDMQVSEAQLSVGDRVSLGGLELMFQ